MSNPKKPVVIDLEPAAPNAHASSKSATPKIIEPTTTTKHTPASAPPVPDLEFGLSDAAPEGRAMRTMAALAGRKPSRLVGLFWAALIALVGFAASVAAWDFVTALLARNPVLGGIATGLLGLALGLLVLMCGRELMALGRLRRMDKMRKSADAALSEQSLDAAKEVCAKLVKLYHPRSELAVASESVTQGLPDQFDAAGAITLAERQLIAPLDAAAILEIEAASRQVAMITTIVPLALADLAVALTANLRMIRRIAEIYGGRAGLLGGWRLTRAVLTHLVATGAVAVGDDLIGSVAGGGLMAKVSRRFGEGIVNGALTARVGLAAMDVCRPVPFLAQNKPSVTGVVKRALVGLFLSPKEKS
ncbi:MAG: TIGR01620 family protein [Pseudomonadota bacterium]